MVKLPVYLDNNATTPCDPRVVEAMLPYFTERFGNAASRSHSYGWIAEEAVELAREQAAKLIGAEPKEMIFTSGATEASNLALKGVYEAYTRKGNHIITAVTEHKAVLDSCRHLERMGADVTYLPVRPDGRIEPADIEAAIKPGTIMIAVMYANNETGVIHPAGDIGRIAKQHEVIYFCDATQAAGKIPVNVNTDGIDLLAFSSHKMYGPKGAGALFVRRKNPRVKPAAQMDGGGHEKGMRSGTLNVPGIVGFGKACELALNEMPQEAKRLGAMRDDFESTLLKQEGVRVNGSREHRLPHVSNLSFKSLEGEALMMGVNKTLAVSSGSACSSASMEPSYVLKALGLEDSDAFSSLRFSLGRFTTEQDIAFAISELTQAVQRLREAGLRFEV